MIGYDSEAWYNAKKSNFAQQDINYGPTNKMELPCDTCSNNLLCMENQTSCTAFREWTIRGEYNPADVELKLKKVA